MYLGSVIESRARTGRIDTGTLSQVWPTFDKKEQYLRYEALPDAPGICPDRNI